MNVVIADCLPGFHHPIGNATVCVPDEPVPVTPVPTLGDYSTVSLALLIAALAMLYLHRKE